MREELPRLASRIGKHPFAIVGNIPYYLTGHLFHLIEELPQRPRNVVLLVQKEVATRAAALPPKANKLSAALQYWSQPTIVCTVPKDAFFPVPQVHSAVLALATLRTMCERNAEESAQYYRALHALFPHPRKTIMNNLREALTRNQSRIPSADEHTL